jgi:transposase
LLQTQRRNQTVLLKWLRDIATGPVSAFPGHGQMKPEQLEIARLRRDVPKAQGGARHPQKKPV